MKDKIAKEITKLDLKIEQLKNYIDNTYIEHLDGKIAFEQYDRLTLKFKGEIEILNEKKLKFLKELDDIDNTNHKEEQEKIFRRMQEFLSMQRPSRELLANLIDKITISENKTVEIHYRFRAY